jgi:flagellar biosynthesis protein FlhG
LQFIRQNFEAFMERPDAGTWLAQIHRWLFIERKPLAIVRQKLAVLSIRARVVAVTSGKGGVGKTTISVNLALALARMGWRVLVFDADLGMANAHIFSGVQPRTTLVDVLERRATLADAVTTGPEGIGMICGASGIPWLADLEAARLAMLCRDLQYLAEGYDILLLDTGAGISAQVMHFLGMANDIVVVTTPNLAATLDAYGIVKAVREGGLDGQMHLLVNQVQDEAEAMRVTERITGCSQRFLGFKPTVLGFLGRDPAVEKANQNRRSLAQIDPAGQSVARLKEMAERLYGHPPGCEEAPGEEPRAVPQPARRTPAAKFSSAAA